VKILYIHTVSLEQQKANVIQVLQMCQACVRLGHSVTMMIPEPENHADSGEIAGKILGVKNPDFQINTYRTRIFPGSFKAPGVLGPVLKGIRNVSFDVVFVRDYLLFCVLIFKGYPVIFESHYYYLNKRWKKIIFCFLERFVVRASGRKNCRLFIAISDRLRTYWVQKGIPSSKLLVCHDGVDLNAYRCAPYPLRKTFSIPESGKIILYSGSLTRDRGIEWMIRLAGDYSMHQFVVIGGSEDEVRYYEDMARSRQMINIRFLGYISHAEIPSFLLSADILLMLWSTAVASIDYCSPLKLFEYLASGKTIVGFRFPTILEVIDEYQNAFLAHPDSYEDLRNGLNQALQESEHERGKRSENNIRLAREYTWEKRCEKIFCQTDLCN